MTNSTPSSNSQDQTLPFANLVVRVSPINRDGQATTEGSSKLYPLNLAGLTLGSSAGNHIVLQNIAPTHLLLRRSETEAFVRVMSAKQPTHLNNQKLESKEYIWWLRDQLVIGYYSPLNGEPIAAYLLELVIQNQPTNTPTIQPATLPIQQLTAVDNEPIAIDVPPLALVPGVPSIWPVTLQLVSGQSIAVQITIEEAAGILQFHALTKPFVLEQNQKHCEAIEVTVYERPENLPGDYKMTLTVQAMKNATPLLTRNPTWAIKPYLLAPALQLEGSPQRVHALRLPLLPPKWKDGTAAYTIRLTNRSNVREYYVMTIDSRDASLRFQPESRALRLEPGITTTIPLTVTQLHVEVATEGHDSQFLVRIKPDNQPEPNPAPGRYTLLSRGNLLRQLAIAAGLLCFACLLLAAYLVPAIAKSQAIKMQTQTATASAAMALTAAAIPSTVTLTPPPATTPTVISYTAMISAQLATQVISEAIFAHNQAETAAAPTNTAIAIGIQTANARDINATGTASILNTQVAVANGTVAAAQQQATAIAQIQTAVAAAQQKVDSTAAAKSGALEKTEQALATTQAQVTSTPPPNITGLMFSAAPSTIQAGKPFNIAVSLVGDNGQIVPINDVIVTLSITGLNTSINKTANSRNGVARFQGLTLTKVGNWHFHANVNDKQTNNDIEIGVTAGVANHFGIVNTLPSTVTSGVGFDLQLQAIDGYGNLDQNYTKPFSLQVTNGLQATYDPKSFANGTVTIHITITATTPVQGVSIQIKSDKINFRSPPFAISPVCRNSTCPSPAP